MVRGADLERRFIANERGTGQRSVKTLGEHEGPGQARAAG